MSEQLDTSLQERSDRHSIVDWPVKDLLLDAENPRLPRLQGKPSQIDLLTHIVRAYAINELMDSFVVNGYFEEEPLVGVPDKADCTKLIIVEGNRRLAALKLLLGLADLTSTRTLRTRIPRLTQSRRRELSEVPVRVYPEGRSAVLAYLGYRHITGVQHWDSYAKARYVSQLVEAGNDLKDIQRRIGDRHETAPRLLRAYLVWDQAENLSLIPTRNGYTPPFSYLFTALTFRPVLSFLGLAAQGRPRAVRPDRIPQLKEITTFLFGDQGAGKKPAIEDSRQIKLLSQAVSSVQALEKLRAGESITDAIEAIPVAEARLEKLIRGAWERIDQATDLATETRANDQLKQLAKDCILASQQLLKALK